MPVANVVLPTLEVTSIRLGDASKRSVDASTGLERLFDVRACASQLVGAVAGEVVAAAVMARFILVGVPSSASSWLRAIVGLDLGWELARGSVAVLMSDWLARDMGGSPLTSGRVGTGGRAVFFLHMRCTLACSSRNS